MGYGADAAKRAGGSGRIDLRSDTVTHPTPEMRRAMASAEVGDDVFEDDPTVAELEARAADLLGKEAGLFVASGTMGNLVSVMAHVPRGGEIITPAEGHIPNDEAANYAVVAGAGLRPVHETPSGEMPIDAVVDAIQDASDPHSAITSLVVVENCHAHTFSRPISPAYMKELRAALKPAGIPIHVDGARLFNAVVALNVSARDLVKDAESATFCLSKGLAAPIGSVVVGKKDFIWRARRARKLLGGGMRQVGILAAAGLVALSDGPEGTVKRLAEDHVNARVLAEALTDMQGIISPGYNAQPEGDRLDPSRVVTNFVIFKVEGGLKRREKFLDELEKRGVLMIAYTHGQIRAVTHYGVDEADIQKVIKATSEALAASA
ncbi:MAG: GntG family PLP-dependent aldolase [Candidatus Limnocylindrus sp.]|jgi:threonine aldolase